MKLARKCSIESEGGEQTVAAILWLSRGALCYNPFCYGFSRCCFLTISPCLSAFPLVMGRMKTHISFSTTVVLYAASFAVFGVVWSVFSGCLFCGILGELKCAGVVPKRCGVQERKKNEPRKI
ncbi:hypothetical protein [Bartonella gliris]|uniref:hypothetical protein n=1 Tax=Bartonella gliris TaxID=3004109 RepID=UPI003873970D